MVNRINDVYEIFKDYFGEEKVDLQDSIEPNIKHIIVHYDKATVTNEQDKSIDIYDLFVRTQVHTSGTMIGAFEFLRTTYTQAQVSVNYVHSHFPPSAMGTWYTTCLGSGPIRTTISRLAASFSEDTWMIYCRELDQYVHVESMAGGPYIYMSNVTSRDRGYLEDMSYFTMPGHNRGLNRGYDFHTTIISSKEILKKILESNELIINFDGVKYTIGNSIFDFIVLSSKCLIKCLEEKGESIEGESQSFAPTCILSNRKIYSLANTLSNNDSFRRNFEGRVGVTFKGTDYIYRIIVPNQRETASTVRILKPKYSAKLYFQIINLINIIYGNPENNNSKRYYYI